MAAKKTAKAKAEGEPKATGPTREYLQARIDAYRAENQALAQVLQDEVMQRVRAEVRAEAEAARAADAESDLNAEVEEARARAEKAERERDAARRSRTGPPASSPS